MALAPNRTAIVIAGTWNQAIFTQEWVRDRLFTELEGDVPNVDLQIGNSAVRYSKEGYSVTLTTLPYRAIVGIADASIDSLNEQERVALRLLDNTLGAPLSGIGVNFGFGFQSQSDKFKNYLFHQ